MGFGYKDLQKWWLIKKKHEQGTHSTKMGTDKSFENTPNALKFICPNCLPKLKSLGFRWKKASLGVRSPCTSFFYMRYSHDTRYIAKTAMHLQTMVGISYFCPKIMRYFATKSVEIKTYQTCSKSINKSGVIYSFLHEKVWKNLKIILASILFWNLRVLNHSSISENKILINFWTKFENSDTSADYVKVFVGIPLTG